MVTCVHASADVDDLESELEAADDAVVCLRRDVTAREEKLSRATSSNAALQAQSDEMTAELARFQTEMESMEASLAEVCRSTLWNEDTEPKKGAASWMPDAAF